jgi:hypothetical protein
MAQKLNAMPKRRGRASVHPWDQWADGSVWKITQGEDFPGAVESMRTQLYGKARRLDKNLELVVEGESISFRMTPKDEDAS